MRSVLRTFAEREEPVSPLVSVFIGTFLHLKVQIYASVYSKSTQLG
jgi:hypothetical protein